MLAALLVPAAIDARVVHDAKEIVAAHGCDGPPGLDQVYNVGRARTAVHERVVHV